MSVAVKTKRFRMNKYSKHTLLLLFIIGAQFAFGQFTLSDDAKISLMTTAPWPGEAYAMYGHTALYVEDDSLEIDAVFNYGFFDMSQPNFMYNFVRGKTDYLLGIQSFDQFVESYGYKGVEVVKQELNLSKEERQQLWDALYINQMPENREYRYNYFYDNCVTRPRDLIEKFTEGEIQYPQDKHEQSYRDLIHECVGGHPWMKFGIDLIIGNDADKPITLRQKMFLPAYLMHTLDETTVLKSNSELKPIVSSKVVVLEDVTVRNSINEWSLFSPNTIAFAILLLTIIISFIQYQNKKKTYTIKIFDTILFAAFGAGGVIIFFLMFFSEHPAVGSNWNFTWMNIFALVFAVFFWIKPLKQVVNIYHFINFVVLTLFLLLWWLIPQQMPFASIPLSLSLWLRSVVNTILRREKIKTKLHYATSGHIRAGWER